MPRTHQPAILIVEDNEDVAHAHALALDEAYETTIAIGGEAALDAMDDGIDAVILDRRMPEMHGDDVLSELRARSYDCPVIMATAVGPDLNILEMDFDDYLTKPIDGEMLRETIAQHVPSDRDDRLEEYFRLTSKIDVLESEHSQQTLKQSDRYQELQERVTELRWNLETDIDDFESLVETREQIDRDD